jgi:hypothetical protein
MDDGSDSGRRFTSFTRRTDEYPGPGILPSTGRSLYVTLRAAP